MKEFIGLLAALITIFVFVFNKTSLQECIAYLHLPIAQTNSDSRIEVPNLISLPIDNATNKLNSLGLEYSITKKLTPVASGTVLDQKPNSGILVTPSSKITLTVSYGEEIKFHSKKPRGFIGKWEGAGQQDKYMSWSIQIIFKKDQYTIKYPSLKCDGVLTLVLDNENELYFKEHITKGQCVDNGHITITLFNENEAGYIWYFANGKRGAVGSLKKIKEENN